MSMLRLQFDDFEPDVFLNSRLKFVFNYSLEYIQKRVRK